jgi:hypothetical protein
MVKRRAFLGGTLGAATLVTCKAQSATAIAQHTGFQAAPEPLVWPIATKLQPGVRSFVGHADTVLDVIGRIGAPPSLVIFTEGNHLMVLSSDDIVGAFPAWAKSQPQYANLDLTNIVFGHPASAHPCADDTHWSSCPRQSHARSKSYLWVLPRHLHGLPGAIAAVASGGRNRATGAFLLQKSRCWIACPQRQSTWHSRPS